MNIHQIAQQVQPHVIPVAGRSVIYASGMGVVLAAPRLGDPWATAALTIAFAVAVLLFPARDQRDRLVVALLAAAGATLLVALEWIGVWRGQWTYPGSQSSRLVHEVNLAAARIWSMLPRSATSLFDLPLIGQATVPLWIWPCRALVMLAAFDVLRTVDSIMHTFA